MHAFCLHQLLGQLLIGDVFLLELYMPGLVDKKHCKCLFIIIINVFNFDGKEPRFLVTVLDLVDLGLYVLLLCLCVRFEELL